MQVSDKLQRHLNRIILVGKAINIEFKIKLIKGKIQIILSSLKNQKPSKINKEKNNKGHSNSVLIHKLIHREKNKTRYKWRLYLI